MKTLVVRPLGGLANRMRAIEAASVYAKKFMARLIIIWEENEFLFATFEQCFEPIDGVKVININTLGQGLYFRAKRKVLNIFFLWLGKLIFDIRLYDITIKKYLSKDKTPRLEETFFEIITKSNKTVYLETCYEFYPSPKSLLLTIKKNIREKAITILEPYNEFIGVHIRRTDNLEAIDNSPTELFIEKMNVILQERPTIKFYISTDSDELLHNLKNIYKDKVFSGAVQRARHTTEGIMSALIDLYCLSKSKKILGSFDSSFSEMAAKMGNVPLEIITKNA